MSKNGTLTPEMAREALQEERAARAQSCLEELKRVLEEYNCIMVPITTIRAGRIEQTFEVVARD